MIKNMSLSDFKSINSLSTNISIDNSLCISILNSSDLKEEFFPLSSRWKSSLRLVFDDISEEAEGLVLFNKEHAHLILSAALQNDLTINPMYENILIHCTAGVSRSAAISLFLNQLKAGSVIPGFSRYGYACYNRTVFSILLEAYNELASSRSLPSYIEYLRS